MVRLEPVVLLLQKLRPGLEESAPQMHTLATRGRSVCPEAASARWPCRVGMAANSEGWHVLVLGMRGRECHARLFAARLSDLQLRQFSKVCFAAQVLTPYVWNSQ